MKLIKPKFEIIEQKPGLQGILEQIEIAARNCYKSESNIKYDSNGNSLTAKDFVDKVVNQYQHQSVAEHGTVYLKSREWDRDPLKHYAGNPFSKYVHLYIDTEVCQDDTSYLYEEYVTTNYRVIIENNWIDDLKYLCEPTEFHKKRVSVKFVCDRGVLQEFRTHRVFSRDDDDNFICDIGNFSACAESTRYCNYSKDKFDNELTFIIPCWTSLIEGYYGFEYSTSMDIKGGPLTISKGYLYFDKPPITDMEISEAEAINDENTPFIDSLDTAEQSYLKLLDQGWKPQQARAVLPNALKTELIMTGFISDWKHFFELRSNKYGRGGAHPQADELATPLYEEFQRRNYL